MTPRTIPQAAADLVTKLAGFGLAAVVTTTVLAGLGGMADRQYESAVLAQARMAPVQAVVVATSEPSGL